KDPEALALVKELALPLKALNAEEVTGSDDMGSDLRAMVKEGSIPNVNVTQDMSSYFEWHHTAGDTLDKIDPDELKQVVAAYVVITEGLVSGARTLPRAPQPVQR